MVMKELDIGTIPDSLPPKEEIVGVMVQDVEVGLKISTTLPCSTMEKVLMVLGEAYLGLGLALSPPIIQVVLVYHLVLYLW